MKKPIVILCIVGLVLGALAVGGYFFFYKSKVTPEISAVTPTPTPAPTLVSWDDPAGFTVSYPENLSINTHDEDKINYAHVELTDKNHPGGIVLWVKDLPKGISDTKSWGKKVATSSSALSFDTTLGAKPAQKIILSDTPKIVMTGVVWDGVLWLIEANLSDETYWQSVYDVVANSFVFKPLPTAPAAGGNTNVADEEEVLE